MSKLRVLFIVLVLLAVSLGLSINRIKTAADAGDELCPIFVEDIFGGWQNWWRKSSGADDPIDIVVRTGPSASPDGASLAEQE